MLCSIPEVLLFANLYPDFCVENVLIKVQVLRLDIRYSNTTSWSIHLFVLMIIGNAVTLQWIADLSRNSSTITSEGLPVLDALTVITRSMHNCRVFGYYGGIQKLTALMKGIISIKRCWAQFFVFYFYICLYMCKFICLLHSVCTVWWNILALHWLKSCISFSDFQFWILFLH